MILVMVVPLCLFSHGDNLRCVAMLAGGGHSSASDGDHDGIVVPARCIFSPPAGSFQERTPSVSVI